MAHTTGRAAAALALTAGLAVGFAQPAGAQVNPGYQNTPRRSVTQDANWETLSNLPMTTVFALPGYGWRAEFTVTVGARWDSGLFGGQPWGNVEGRAEVRSRGRIVSPALIAVHVVPAFNGQWLARCQAHISGWNRWESVAFRGSNTCAGPTVAGAGTNYLPGEYSACVVAEGWAFPDQPSSRFDAVACPRPAVRWA